MNKIEIEKQLDFLISVGEDRGTKEFLKELKKGILEHIEKLEKEIKVQQDIMDQQVQLINEMGNEK